MLSDATISYFMKVKEGDRILLLNPKRKYLVKVEKGKKFCTDLGIINFDEIIGKEYGSFVTTHKDEKFLVAKPRRIDFIEKMVRKPQIILPKDAGIIAALAGIGKEDVVVDAGTGSGALALFLSNIAKEVYTYERRKEFYDVAKKNFENANVKNVVLRLRDISEGINEKNVDVITLDLDSPEKIIKLAKQALKPAGFIVIYSPCIEKVKEVVKRLKEENFVEIKVVECLLREYEVKEKCTRPKTKMLGHTGYIIFARKFE